MADLGKLREEFEKKAHIFEEAREEFKKKYPNGQCEVFMCQNHKWEHPEKGWLCVCEEHFREIDAGIRRVPPLRKHLDYCSISRRTFIVDNIPDDLPDTDIDVGKI